MAIFTAIGTDLLFEVTPSEMPLLAQPGLGQMLPCMPFKSTPCPPPRPSSVSALSLLAISASQETQRQVQLCSLYTAQGLWPRQWDGLICKSLLHVLSHELCPEEWGVFI